MSKIIFFFHLGTKVLDDILDKCKSHGNKRGLGYISKTKTPTSGDIVFIKGKKETPNQVASSSTPLLCTHCKKSRHTKSRCHTRFLEKYETQLNRLVDDFNSLKNIILHTRKEKKINSKPKTKKNFSSSPPKVKQVWLRKDKPKCNVVLTALRARAPSEWYFDSGCSRYKPFFTSFENFNGGNVTFGNGNVAQVRHKGNVSILGCP